MALLKENHEKAFEALVGLHRYLADEVTFEKNLGEEVRRLPADAARHYAPGSGQSAVLTLLKEAGVTSDRLQAS